MNTLDVDYENRVYNFNINNREIILNISELYELQRLLKDELLKSPPYGTKTKIRNAFRCKPKNSYNKKTKIIDLFNKYHINTKTKKETFIKIANELNISIKAVEKAIYSK
ncbi:hypothetical protein KKG81_06045 [bacterium]|nr:hypothetical protein [bacterium]